MVALPEEAAFDGRPFDIALVRVHSANPAGAARIGQASRRWEYRVRIDAGSEALRYPL
ncbi:hypothetical protein ACIA5C_07710 [Actinoplanes sp. NPDC051343]|uniref:hypothetical protein n=1 Tax=Actinoplanes sp. NPDC051343 TaxID=3363906 RepID=UPI00379108CA